MSTSSPQSLAVARLYVALMGRAPDAEGFAFWLAALNNGVSEATLASGFLASPEGQTIYPSGQTSEQFVRNFYSAVLGRTPDAEGLAFWTAALVSQGGGANPGAQASLITQILAIASTPLDPRPEGLTDAQYAQAVADRALLANKAEFGVYFATELGSNDITMAKKALALVTDNPASLTAAREFPITGGVPPVPSVPPIPTLVLTAAESGEEMFLKLMDNPNHAVTVNVTGMDAEQLSVVAYVVDRISDRGITGTLVLDADLYESQISVLLGASRALAATVQVNAANMNADQLDAVLQGAAAITSLSVDASIDASALSILLSAPMLTPVTVSVSANNMNVAQVVALGLGAANIDSLSNLPELALGDASITDAVTQGLLSASSPASVRVSQLGLASAVELNLIAANIAKMAAMSGALTLTSATSATTIAALLGAKVAGLGDAITLDVQGMDSDQLAAVAGAVAGVSLLTINSNIDAATISAVLAMPGMSTVDVQVNAANMTVEQTDALAQGAAAIASLNIDASLDASALSTLLSATALARANVSVSASGMDAAQVVTLGLNATNIDTLTNLPKLVLGDAAMTDAVTDGLLSKASGATLTATVTGASSAEISSLVTNLSKVASGGIDGSLTLSAGDVALINPTMLSSKLAPGTPVSVVGSVANDVIDLSGWSMPLRVDGGAGADNIRLGSGNQTVFIASHAESQRGASLSDTDTSNIQTISNFSPQSVLRFSTAADAFGEGITFQAGTIALHDGQTNAVDIVSLDDLVKLLNILASFANFVGSTSNRPEILMVNSYVYNEGVTPSGLANKTFFVLNDKNAAISLDDTIIAIDNYVVTIAGATPAFEAGV